MSRKILDLPEGMKLPEPSANTMVARPTPRQLAVFGQQRAITCGTCRFFRKDTGQKIMRNTKFLGMLTRDAGWKKEHLCEDPSEMGICDQKSSREEMTVTGPRVAACEFYKRDTR